MKSLIAATALAAVLSATTAAYAGHPLLPNGWPAPESKHLTLTPEQIEHREYMNVQRETFPGNQPNVQSSRTRKNAEMARGALPHQSYPSYYDDDARHRP
jgi:hypothetical protein